MMRAGGAFLPLAARFIKNRLIDYRRREARHLTVVSLDSATDDTDGDERPALVDQIATEHSDMDEGMVREATRVERCVDSRARCAPRDLRRVVC